MVMWESSLTRPSPRPTGHGSETVSYTHLVVNKMAYHFRKPERGEVFVFATRGIEGIANKGSSTGQEGGTSVSYTHLDVYKRQRQY